MFDTRSILLGFWIAGHTEKRWPSRYAEIIVPFSWNINITAYSLSNSTS
jgi:hypothetical protein